MKNTDQLCTRILASRDRLYRLAYSYVRNEEDAMDIVQEVAYKALKNERKLRKPEFLSTWLYRVTVNTSLDFLRRSRRESAGAAVPEDGRSDDYSRLDLFEQLELLDEKSRAVVILRFFEDRTLQQISEITGEGLNTVKTRLYRALQTLKIRLEDGRDQI